MVDRRLPGRREPRTGRFTCPVAGCAQQAVGEVAPACSVHGRRMIKQS